MIVVRWRVNVELAPALVLSLFSVPSRTQSASTLPRTDQRSHRHQSALP